MNIDRRQFARLTAGAAVAPLALPANAEYFVYVGSYVGPKSKGIHVWRFDPASGKLTALGAAAESANPSFLAMDSEHRRVFAANEVGNFGGQRSGSVSSFSMDPATGKLTAINSTASKGSGPCYVSLDKSGKWLFVANYGGGSVAVVPIGADGRLGEATSFVQHTGSSVNPKRQREAHAHCIKPSPDGRFVIATDLGTDEVKVYRFDSDKGTLTPNNPSSFKPKPGSGPRHFAFHPSKPLIYVIGELDSTITAASWDPKAGVMKELQVVSTVPKGFTGENTTAEIVVHPNGRTLYGSNRGHDSIAIFNIDANGKLTPAGHESTRGQMPRNFALDPTSRYLFAANQKSDNVQVFKVAASGALEHTGSTLDIGSPVCVRFMRA